MGPRKRPLEHSPDQANKSRALGSSNPLTCTDSATIAFGERVKDTALPEDSHDPAAPSLFNEPDQSPPYGSMGARVNPFRPRDPPSGAGGRPSSTRPGPSGTQGDLSSPRKGLLGALAGPSVANPYPSGKQAGSSQRAPIPAPAKPQALESNTRPVGTMRAPAKPSANALSSSAEAVRRANGLRVSPNKPMYVRQDGGQARPLPNSNQVPMPYHSASRSANPGANEIRPSGPRHSFPAGYRGIPNSVQELQLRERAPSASKSSPF